MLRSERLGMALMRGRRAGPHVSPLLVAPYHGPWSHRTRERGRMIHRNVLGSLSEEPGAGAPQTRRRLPCRSAEVREVPAAPAPTPLPGHLCEQCFDAPAVLVVPAPEGLGIRGTARVFEIDPNTVLHWLIETTEQLNGFPTYFLNELQIIHRRSHGMRASGRARLPTCVVRRRWVLRCMSLSSARGKPRLLRCLLCLHQPLSPEPGAC
jgi:hypothetical protein